MVIFRKCADALLALKSQYVSQPTSLVFLQHPRRVLKAFNHSSATKGPGAVIMYLRIALLRNRIPHRIISYKESIRDEAIKASEKYSDIQQVFAPSFSSNIENLKQLISIFPKARLLIGPNFNFPLAELETLLHSQYCTAQINLVLPSAEIESVFVTKYATLKKTQETFFVMPSTVDEEIWRPPKKRGKQILVYHKGVWNTDDEKLLMSICNLFPEQINLMEYGKYTTKQFRYELRRSHGLIYLGDTESQGLALLEAWSCDVATFVRIPSKLEPKTGGKNELYGSRETHFAPFLTELTGSYFRTLEELKFLLVSLNEGTRKYSPRDWVIKNLSTGKFKKLLSSKWTNHEK